MAAGHLHGRVADEATPVNINMTSLSQYPKSSVGIRRLLSNTQIRTEGASRDAPSVNDTFCSAKISIEWPGRELNPDTRILRAYTFVSERVFSFYGVPFRVHVHSLNQRTKFSQRAERRVACSRRNGRHAVDTEFRSVGHADIGEGQPRHKSDMVQQLAASHDAPCT